jgi:hypothetical protein
MDDTLQPHQETEEIKLDAKANGKKRNIRKVKKDSVTNSEYSGGATTANSLNCPPGNISDQHRYVSNHVVSHFNESMATNSMRSHNITTTEVALSDKLSSRREYRPRNTNQGGGPIIVEIEEDEQKNENESQIFMRRPDSNEIS